MSFIKEWKRSFYCGQLTDEHVGQNINLMGWVDNRRDHGGLVFVDLRDREGTVQVVLDPNNDKMKVAKDFRHETVVAIRGLVQARPEGMINDKLKTGKVEVQAELCEILSQAETPPFQIHSTNVSEVLRLKYRYLDFRTPKLTNYLRTRHELMQSVRKFLTDDGFYEIETPILYKSTPEGARDYLVPSRVHQGHFFALPQSPQTLKQLLMIGGMDRYFQIARCFRDEDLRADRQPEFTQIDIEMSFVEEDDIISMTERLLKKIWKDVKNEDVGEIPKMTYKEAMDRYGSDKPDIRFGLEITDLAETVSNLGFRVFDDAIASGGVVRGIGLEDAHNFSRGKLDKLTGLAKRAGAKGLVWIKVDEKGQLSSPVLKVLGEEKTKKLFDALVDADKGLALVVADQYDTACSVLSSLRLNLGGEFSLIDTSRDAFLWVTDFPLLEFVPDEKRYVARHHPFTMPKDENVGNLLGDQAQQKPGEYLAKAYDLVCNGYELAGGSIRIHRNDIQQGMFKLLGMSPEEAEEKFGFFLEALKYGTPPHGGIAWGMDRLAMILCGTEAIRDVIAFPKTTKATDLMANAPSLVDQHQMLELGVRLAPSVEKKLSEEGSNISKDEDL